jgi:hypothetical protein
MQTLSHSRRSWLSSLLLFVLAVVWPRVRRQATLDRRTRAKTVVDGTTVRPNRLPQCGEAWPQFFGTLRFFGWPKSDEV